VERFTDLLFLAQVALLFGALSWWLTPARHPGRAMLVITAWVALLGYLSLGGYFANFRSLPPRILPALLLPLLAGVLLKMGTYGMVRFSLPLFPNISHLLAPLISALAVAGFFQWFANFLVSFSFPVMAEKLGLALSYSFYGVCAVISFFLVQKLVHETRGKELEQMSGH